MRFQIVMQDEQWGEQVTGNLERKLTQISLILEIKLLKLVIQIP